MPANQMTLTMISDLAPGFECQPNIKKLVFPRVEVMHMMQNEADPINNTRPDNRMGVSSEFS
jgi:hypothetical protein